MDRFSSGLDTRLRWIVFFMALTVRFFFFIQNVDSPVFFAPLVDAGTYHDLALRFARQGWIGEGFFWQPFLYPFSLGYINVITGGSILAAKLIQVALGVLTCVLTYELGRKAAGRTAGFLAALIICFYGPMLVFETRLVGAVPAACIGVALLWMFLSAKQRLRNPVIFGLGMISAAAVLIRPTFFPFAALAFLWLLWVMLRDRVSFPRMLGHAGFWCAGFLLLTAPVGWMNAHTAEGRWSFLPYSGAVNLYVGNNPDICRTLTVRPGWEWERLLDMPRFHGIESPAEHPPFFRRQVMDFAAAQPLQFAENLGRKSLRLISSREIPRNVDMYLYRDWSGILRLLMGKAGPFGWPFGVIFPFAAAAALAAFRRLKIELWVFLAVHASVLVLVFPAARYRMELIPVLAVAAAVGMTAVWRHILNRNGKALLGYAFILAAGAAASVFPGPFCEEKSPYKAELCQFLAIHHLEAGQMNQAETLVRRAAALQPKRSGAYVVWGDIMGYKGRFNDAFLRYQQAMQLNPDRDDAWRKMGTLAYLAGRHAEAETLLRGAMEINPFVGKTRVILGRLLEKTGQEQDALTQYREALEERVKLDKIDKSEALMRVALLSWEDESAEKMLHRLQEALRLNPGKPEILMSLAWLRAVYPEEGIRAEQTAPQLARTALQLTRDKVFALDVLAASLAAAGDYDKAAETAKQALDLAGHFPAESNIQKEFALRLDAYMNAKPWRSRRPPSWYRYSPEGVAPRHL